MPATPNGALNAAPCRAPNGAPCGTRGASADDDPRDDVPEATGLPCRIVVCRDCCCGTAKVPGLDHAAQTERLREAAPVRVSDCLDVCDQANVVVVQPSTAGRAAGARPVWLGLVNDPDATEDIVAWVRAGGPGVAPPPEILGLLHACVPPGRRAAS